MISQCGKYGETIAVNNLIRLVLGRGIEDFGIPWFKRYKKKKSSTIGWKTPNLLPDTKCFKE